LWRADDSGPLFAKNTAGAALLLAGREDGQVRQRDKKPHQLEMTLALVAILIMILETWVSARGFDFFY
jgi:hypothetical protein